MKFLSQLIDEVFDKTIVNHISLSCFQIALPFPYIIWNMVTSYSKGQSFLRQPEVGQNIIMFIIFSRWKDKYKSCYICCRGKVKTTIANTPGKPLFIKRYFAFIPFLHRHPADSLFYPLIQTQLPKRIFLARRFFCRITRSHHLIYSDGFVEGWICLFPNLRVSPIFRFISTIDNGIKSWVMFSAFQNVLCLLVNFIAD